MKNEPGSRTPPTPEEWLAPYEPSPEDPFDRKKAAHLLRRAAFGGSEAEVLKTVELGPQNAIDRLLAPPAGGQEPFARLLEDLDGELLDLGQEENLRAWWVYRMVHTTDPLREKLTLFWHGHFATSIRKVARAALMQAQNELFRRLALAPFKELLLGVARDPAMLVWLDNRANQKGRPNENFARELMELFTLGVGSYSEADVKEAARAFTGWHLRENEFFFNAGAHDQGEKTFLGRKGTLDGEDIVDVILEQEACAPFLVRKLWRFFVSESAPDGVLELLAARFRSSGYRVDDLLATLLRSRIFFAAPSYRARIKSPVEFVLGMVRSLEVRAESRGLAKTIGVLGQVLFAPVTVKGWDGEKSWVSAQFMVNRANAAMAATALRGVKTESRFNPMPMLERKGASGSPEAVLAALAEILLDGELSEDARKTLLHYLVHNDRGGDREVPWPKAPRGGVPRDVGFVDGKARGAAHLIMTLSEYQLA